MALPALASLEDLALAMQVDPGALPDGADRVLERVSAIVRKESRNTFQRRTTTLARNVGFDWIPLPLGPVVSVGSVTIGGNAIGFRWNDQTQRLYVGACGVASVTFTHGYAEVPGDVVAVVLSAAQRVLTNPNDLRQETVGSISVTYAAETIGSSLSQADRDLLARYRRQSAVVRQV